MSGRGQELPIDELWRDGDWHTDARFLKQVDGIDSRRGRNRSTQARLGELPALVLQSPESKAPLPILEAKDLPAAAEALSPPKKLRAPMQTAAMRAIIKQYSTRLAAR